MALSRTWDTSYEGSPSDTNAAKEGGLRIRNLKVDVRERFEIDHSMASDADDGKHLKITMPQKTSDGLEDPANIASTGILFTKDVDGEAELFYMDGAGNKFQLTSVGGSGLLTTKNNWTKAQYTGPETLTDGATVTPDLDLSNAFHWTIAGNRTLAAPSNRASGQSFVIRVTQDGTGGRTITYNSIYKFPSGFEKQPSDGANDVSLLSCYYDGTSVLCSMLRDFG